MTHQWKTGSGSVVSLLDSMRMELCLQILRKSCCLSHYSSETDLRGDFYTEAAYFLMTILFFLDFFVLAALFEFKMSRVALSWLDPFR
mmetsp:Transcript_32339/g.31743  ORF Transcript_32339/g.31743 Transcript_32339/m.31743 type:complete len:88 (-) Transcript_32339:409-672(-)